MRTSNRSALARIAAVVGATLIVLSSLALPTGAAVIANGAIQGTITCEGNPVAGVVVSISGPAPSTSTIWTGTTDATGRYFTDFILPPGSYVVQQYYNLGVCQFAEMVKTTSVQSGMIATVNFAGGQCADLIRNGGFETLDVWQIGPTPWPAAYVGSPVRSGIRSMRSGIEPWSPDMVSESSFYQAVTIPATAANATLSFWYRPYTQEPLASQELDWQALNWAGYSPERTIAGENPAAKRMGDAPDSNWYLYDWQEVLILDQNYQLLEVLQRGLSNAGSGGWINRTYDLTPYKGRTINVYFNTINNGIGNRRTWMYVDDVSLRFCTQPPACIVTPTTQWVNLYGLNSTFHGALLMPGQVVEAYDTAGTLAGCFVVRSPGRYGAMAVYRDDPNTPVDEGLSQGETIRLRVNGEPASPLGPDAPVWTENGALLRVELAVEGTVTRTLNLRAGWNLISFDVMPSPNAIEAVLAPIAGKYSAVLGYTCAQGAISYYPSLPPGINTLTTLDPYHGYWIFMTTAATLTVAGPEVPDNAPLQLCTGWNLISYLPDGALPVPQALSTIAGFYTVVLGFDGTALSYYVQLPPDMNSLRNMAPGLGYWVRTTANVTLIYPSAGLGLLADAPANLDNSAPDVAPSRIWLDAYSLNSQLNGEPIPVGAVVEAFDAGGQKVGSYTVRQAGWFGPMPIYGDDPTTPEDEGAAVGDVLTFTIDGMPALSATGDVVWEGERTLLQVDLATKVRKGVQRDE